MYSVGFSNAKVINHTSILDLSFLDSTQIIPSSVSTPNTSSTSNSMSPYHNLSSLAPFPCDSSTPSIIEVSYPSLVIDLHVFLSHIPTLPSELVIDLPPFDTTHTHHMLIRSKTRSLKP